MKYFRPIAWLLLLSGVRLALAQNPCPAIVETAFDAVNASGFESKAPQRLKP